MFFQGRGNVYLRELDADLNPGPAKIKLCTDSLQFTLSVQSWSHMNKCGPVDQEDARGITSQSAEITLTFADVADKNFALAALGTVNAAGSPGTISNETLPASAEAGDVWFLGGKTRHRAITALTIDGMTVDVDYSLDAASGKVTFLKAFDVSPAPTAAYGYTDPASVSLFTSGQKEYALDYEFINKQQANDAGSLELYRVRFDPASGFDFQSDKEQNLSLKGSCLADTERDPDDSELGQFGRRVL